MDLLPPIQTPWGTAKWKWEDKKWYWPTKDNSTTIGQFLSWDADNTGECSIARVVHSHNFTTVIVWPGPKGEALGVRRQTLPGNCAASDVLAVVLQLLVAVNSASPVASMVATAGFSLGKEEE